MLSVINESIALYLVNPPSGPYLSSTNLKTFNYSTMAYTTRLELIPYSNDTHECWYYIGPSMHLIQGPMP